MDFSNDQTPDGQTQKNLVVTDPFANQGLAIRVEGSMTGDDISTVLEDLRMLHGASGFVWRDNGTEVTSNAVTH